MQERTVTTQNNQFMLDLPFMVIATENPIELEGTYPLPEAQLDRFFCKIKVEAPSHDDLMNILIKTTGTDEVSVKAVFEKPLLLRMQRIIRQIPIAPSILDYVTRLISNTHPQHHKASDGVKKFVRYGSSPRGAQSLVLASKANALISGRFNVSYDDIKAMIKPVLRHRLILNFEAEAEQVDPDNIIDEILSKTPEIS
jgi:MoxR-like ATPase